MTLHFLRFGLFLFLIVCSVSTVVLRVQAQIKIVSADIANIGDRALIGRVPGTGLFDPNLTGPNVVWDLSQQLPDTQFTRSYVSSIQTPYPASLLLNPGAAPTFLLSYATTVPDIRLDFVRAIAPQLPFEFGITLSNVYEFFTKNNNYMDIRFRGFNIQNIPLLFFYDRYDTIFRFTLDYGDRDTSTFAFSFVEPTNNITISARGTRINEVDAYGTVILPVGTFEVLRVKSNIQTFYTLNITQLGLEFEVPVPFGESEIRLFAKGKKIPMVYCSGVQPLIGGAVYDQMEFQDIDRLPTPDFAALMPLSGCRPLTTLFEDRSVDATSVSWNFGDGSTSTDPRPLHTYTTKGKFTVTLTARNQYGTRSLSRSNYVEVDPFTVNFSVDNPQVNDPMGMVQFRNLTSQTLPGSYSYQWDFGNGYFSQDHSPLYFYPQPGIYSVRLIGINPNGCHDTLQRINYLYVNVPAGVEPNDLASNALLRAYPNPATQTLTLDLTQPAASPLAAQLTDVTGRTIWTGALAPNPADPYRLLFDRPAGLAPGVYQLNITLPGAQTGQIRIAFQ